MRCFHTSLVAIACASLLWGCGRMVIEETTEPSSSSIAELSSSSSLVEGSLEIGTAILPSFLVSRMLAKPKTYYPEGVIRIPVANNTASACTLSVSSSIYMLSYFSQTFAIAARTSDTLRLYPGISNTFSTLPQTTEASSYWLQIQITDEHGKLTALDTTVNIFPKTTIAWSVSHGTLTHSYSSSLVEFVDSAVAPHQDGYAQPPYALLGALTLNNLIGRLPGEDLSPFFILNGPASFTYTSVTHNLNSASSQTWYPGARLPSAGDYSIARYNDTPSGDDLLSTTYFTLPDSIFTQFAKSYTSETQRWEFDWIYPADSIAQSVYEYLQTRIKTILPDEPSILSTDAESYQLQQIRTTSQMLQSGTASNTELAALFAGQLRQVGLDPLIVLAPAHKYIGWYITRDHRAANFVDLSELSALDFKSANAQGVALYLADKQKPTTTVLDFAP